MYGVRGRGGFRGLGALTAAGIQRCADVVSGGWYWLRPDCWAYSQDAWTQMAQFPTPPAPAPPAAPSTIQQETQPGAYTPDQAIAQTVQNQQQQMAGFFNSVPDVQDNSGTSGLSATSVIALGVAAGVGLMVLTSGSGRRR